jgi:hypothetical protein
MGCPFRQALESEVVTRQRIEKRLRESEHRFRSTFEQSPAALAHVVGDGPFLRVNQRAEKKCIHEFELSDLELGENVFVDGLTKLDPVVKLLYGRNLPGLLIPPHKFLPSGGFAQVASRPDYLSKLKVSV